MFTSYNEAPIAAGAMQLLAVLADRVSGTMLPATRLLDWLGDEPEPIEGLMPPELATACRRAMYSWSICASSAFRNTTDCPLKLPRFADEAVPLTTACIGAITAFNVLISAAMSERKGIAVTSESSCLAMARTPWPGFFPVRTTSA